MKIKIYDKLWQHIQRKNWPFPDQIFICKDPQERLGQNTWSVAQMRKPGKADLTIRGLFWEKEDALAFANAINE